MFLPSAAYLIQSYMKCYELLANPFHFAGFVKFRQSHLSHHFLNGILWHNSFARAIAVLLRFPVGFEIYYAHTGMAGLKNLFQALRISQEVIDAYSVNAFIVVESAHIVTRDDDFAEFIANVLKGSKLLCGLGFIR